MLTSWLVLVSASHAGEVWDDYLKQAGGDSISAHMAMEADVVLFLGEVIDLEADLKKSDARGDRLAKWHDEAVGGWFEQLWGRIKFAVGLTIGLWLGVYAGS